MPDHIDSSQYPTTQGSLPVFVGNSTMANEPQTSSPITYATQEELTSYPVQEDHMADSPAKFYIRGGETHRPIAKPYTLKSINGVVRTGEGYLAGFSIMESTNAAVVSFTLRDGADANAPIIAVGGYAAGLGATVITPDGGLYFRYGLYLTITSGALIGAVYLRDVLTV